MPEFRELLKGYRRFRDETFPQQRERYADLVAHGQHPKLMVIGCSDSRVDPAQIFDVNPGEIFVVRNVAALVPPTHGYDDLDGVAAAVEFAVGFLEVRQIVVMGHSQCGGCNAALSGELDGSDEGSGAFIARWTQLLREARDNVHGTSPGVGPEAERAMEHAAIRQSIANLRTFDWVRERESGGSLTLRGTWFCLDNGTLHLLDEPSGTFSEVE